MAKQIRIRYGDDEYTLEYTRRTVEEMERNGFDASSVSTKPMTLLPRLFSGAFLANHRKVKQSVIDEIFSNLSDKEVLMENLVELYREPIVTLLDDPEDGENRKNAQWVAGW